MSSSVENKMLLEHLQKLTIQHEREQAIKAGSLPPQQSESVFNRQAADIPTRTSPDFSSVTSEDPERGGGKLTSPARFTDAFTALQAGMLDSRRRPDNPSSGVRLDASSLRGSPT